MNLAPFTKGDWMAFAGAECFADGADPLAGELRCRADLHGTEIEMVATVVLDRRGLELFFVDDDGDTLALVHFSDAYAARAVAMLRDGLAFCEVRAMPGAEVIESVGVR